MSCNNIHDAHELIYEGRVRNLGCLMPGRNQSETLIDNEDLEEDKSIYLISLRDSFLPIHCTTFHVEAYSLHRFSRQFGFCQGIPRMLLEDPRT